MSKKMMLLALAAVSAAMFAVPAFASAESWHQVPTAGGSTGPNFTVAGGKQELENSAGGLISCDGVTGNGSYDANSTTTGTVELTFTGCANGAPTSFLSCTTSGTSSGTITTKKLSFHNIMIDAGTPGVLLTPEGTTFATFSCFGVAVTVTGNGVIGHLSNKCGEKSKTGTLSFTTSATGTQKYQQITTAGTKFDLHSSLNSGATSAQTGSGTVTSVAEAEVVCTNA